MFPDEIPIICCWGSFGTCRGHQSGRWQGERKTGTHDTAVPESPLMLNFIWVCFRSGKTFGEQVGGDQSLGNGWQLKCQFEDQQFRRQWSFLHRGFIWIAWKLIIMELYGKGNSDLGSHQFEVRLFPPKNNWGVWDMVAKATGWFSRLLGWLVGFMRGLIIHPKTNSLQLKPFVSSCSLAFSAILSPSQLRKIIQETQWVDFCCLIKSCRHKSSKPLTLLEPQEVEVASGSACQAGIEKYHFFPAVDFKKDRLHYF